MGIDWHWSSNIWLWILSCVQLNLGPVIVDMAAESAIWMSINRHRSSDVWLWVFSELELGPVVVYVG